MRKQKIQFNKIIAQRLSEQYGCTVVQLDTDTYRRLQTSVSAMTRVPTGKKVKEHQHDFVSFYLAKNNALELDGTVYELPPHCLVIVSPGKAHPWINPGKKNVFVGDLSPQHGPQEVVVAS